MMAILQQIPQQRMIKTLEVPMTAYMAAYPKVQQNMLAI